jgi:hypothetical protein
MRSRITESTRLPTNATYMATLPSCPIVVGHSFGGPLAEKLLGETTELTEFADRGHSLTIDHGWREIADSVLSWLKAKGI